MNEIAIERSYPTPVANSPWLPLLLMSLASQKHSPDTKDHLRPKYDYIVVGAGSAGSVVASRLSELPCVTVLLLEAGKAPPRLTEVPVYSSAFCDSDVDWKYHTVTQRYTAGGFPKRRINVPRGKMLGGTSSINGMLFVRGNYKTFDDWAARGARGWNSTEVLHYFKKMEDCHLPKYCGNGYRGFGGPIATSLANYKPEVQEALFQAHRTLGLNEIDPNGPTQTGASYQQLNTRNGQRCSTAKAYLVPKEKNNNLDIVINAFVTKVIFNKERVATGVMLDFRGLRWYIEAGREVIVSAGAINTPQLLMLSGIGPAAHLTDLGIPVIADLPVGYNLQDHPVIALPYEISRNIKSHQEKINDLNTLMNYINSRSGLLTTSIGIAATSFENYASSNPAKDFPIFETSFREADFKTYKKKVTPKIYKQVYAPYVNKTMLACMTTALQTKTLGSIKLHSTNPFDKPIIDIQLLEEPSDFEAIIEGMKFCQRIFRSEPMRRIGAKPISTLFPGCEEFASNEDLYLRCIAGLITTTNHHFSGTTKMGDTRDPTTVLDPQLRVKTIRGLRVVDASVMPIITSGNTNAPTIMIGEKASDMIKETVQCRRHPLLGGTFVAANAYA